MPTREQQHQDQANRGPQVAVLDHGHDVRGRDAEEGNPTKEEGGDEDETDVVEGAVDWGVRGARWEVAEDPGVDALGGLRAHGEVEADGLGVNFGARAYGGGKKEEDGGGLEHHLRKASASGAQGRIPRGSIERTKAAVIRPIPFEMSLSHL